MMKKQHCLSRRLLSVFTCLNSTLLKLLKEVLHGFERFRGVALPIRDLARDP